MFGQDISTLPRKESLALRRRMGVVFQEFRLLSHLSAFDNVALPLRVTRVRETKIKKNVEELLSWVGLKDHMDARPPTLSGGQQQRVAIARAAINNPQLILADEPTGSLDQQTAKEIFNLFLKFKSRNRTILYATHNRELANRADYKLNINNGNITRSNE